MVRIFGHYFSLRAILFAAFEAAAFVALFNLFKVAAVYLALGKLQALPNQAFFLSLFCATAFCTAAACGMYNRVAFSDSQDLIGRLLTASVLMYFLMAAMISIGELVSDEATDYKLYYVIALGSCAGFYIVSLLFRLNLAATDFNDTALERRILVVGTDEQAVKIHSLKGHSRSPFKTVGFIQVGDGQIDPLLADAAIRREDLAKSNGLLAYAERENIDEIVFASREQRGANLDELLECKLAGIAVTNFTSFWVRQTGQIDLTEVTPGWMVFSSGFRTSWQKTLAKRLLDILVSSLLLVMTLPVTLVVAIAIKLESPGPILYRQQRIGLGGRPYTILKFRSMRADAEKDGVARWASANDSRVTRIGEVLRKTRIDEIPQAVNVLLGDMSFVGPRPERPTFVEELKKKIPFYDIRHRVKPGLTGWAQINYPYGASDEDARAKLAYDLYYVKNWNLFLDAVILFQTARVVMWREGAR